MWYTSKKNDLELNNGLTLVFIYDALMLNVVQERFALPLKFVAFGYIEGYRLYHYRKQVVAMPNHKISARNYGNAKVFGAVYAIQNFNYSAIKLDAYYYCSQARIGQTTLHDMRERLQSDIHLFDLSTVDELLSHHYEPFNTVTGWVYIGNALDNRLISHINYGRYRIVDGIDKTHYKKLLKERGIPCS